MTEYPAEYIRFDPRALAEFFEVHYWPHIGRVVTVHMSSATGHEPVVMALDITPVDDGFTYVTARVLADAGGTDTPVYRHGVDGSVTPDGRIVHVSGRDIGPIAA